jgi:hypothetical protein
MITNKLQIHSKPV